MATGTVKWFNSSKGYGFISPSNGGDDIFAHFSAIETGGHKHLSEGQQVEFDVQDGTKGPQAMRIRPLT
jgi:CspA family cold shock protein